MNILNKLTIKHLKMNKKRTIVTIIGIITIFLSMIGVFIGNEFGNKYGKIAETLGGIVLIGIGLKILLEHLKII